MSRVENPNSSGNGVLIPLATQEVKREWTRRIEAEYGSSAVTQELVLWLIQMAAPRELIDGGLRIVSDELDHAQLSAAVCQAAGHHEPPRILRERLGAGECAWGLMPRGLYRTILEKTIEREYVRRFKELGIEVGS